MDYTAVLFSGGLDSAVLAADALTGGPAHALHVSVGFAWEAEELAMAARLFARPPFAGRIEPPVGLRFDMLDVFPGKKAKFVKNYMRLAGTIQGAVELYVKEVKAKEGQPVNEGDVLLVIDD